jgi:hypothetical protein
MPWTEKIGLEICLRIGYDKIDVTGRTTCIHAVKPCGPGERSMWMRVRKLSCGHGAAAARHRDRDRSPSGARPSRTSLTQRATDAASLLFAALHCSPQSFLLFQTPSPTSRARIVALVDMIRCRCSGTHRVQLQPSATWPHPYDSRLCRV